MTLSKQNERFGLLVAFCLIVIHSIVSLVFIIVDFNAARMMKENKSTLIWSGVAWIVSLLVCLLVLLVLFGLLFMEKVEAKTPSPIQLSYPGMSSSSKDRQDIKTGISTLQSKLSQPSNILPYDSKRVYIVLTGYYLKNAHISSPLPYTELMTYLKDHEVTPIGYVDKSKIYSLSGKEIWPNVPDMSNLLF
jgi:hypothetical protein